MRQPQGWRRLNQREEHMSIWQRLVLGGALALIAVDGAYHLAVWLR